MEAVNLQIDSDGDGIYEKNTTPAYSISTASAENKTSALFTAPANKEIYITAFNLNTFITLITTAPATNAVISIIRHSESPVADLENNVGMYLEIYTKNVNMRSASIKTYYRD